MFRILLFIVALTAGGAAAWIALSMRTAPAVVVQPGPQAPTQDVLVASANLGLGQVLTKDNMHWQSWPEGALNAAYITRSARPDALDALAGSIVRNRMAAGEPIGDGKLAPRNAGFLSAMLPSGKRAVAVRISAESTAGGFILPNDRVDVLHTVAHEGEDKKATERASRTILRNVPVLAIDQTVDEDSKDEKSKSKTAVLGKTATLELDPSQAEALAAAQATGTLSLALRSAADNGEASGIKATTGEAPRPNRYCGDKPMHDGQACINIYRRGRDGIENHPVIVQAEQPEHSDRPPVTQSDRPLVTQRLRQAATRTQ
jgi:pilus assembly protein CpaB